ncbi:PfkB family carbohydrate kinase [Vibrio sp. HN007]|uniref:PfkB family carbohydrate kinase n=1 Tax=Vibrio iocasae TaxID=3098914 RepID=UPI0035D50DD8
MPVNALIKKLPALNNQRQLCLVGAAVVDIISEVDELPKRGTDIELREKGVHVGGCALNIAIAVNRLGLSSLNALPMGRGKWADVIESALAEKSITSNLRNENGDNGWCMALVEPDGERTFLSVSGVENDWNEQTLAQLPIEQDAIIYLSGYQLASESGSTLISWLESLSESIDIFVDFGPRIADISDDVFKRLVALKPIISLNRQEADVLGMQEIDIYVQNWFEQYQCPLILRIDSDGALYSDGKSSGHVPPLKANVVDTIGAGDNHAGGVLAGLASGWSLSDSILLGNAVASYVVSHAGGDCAPNQDEMTDYLQRYL